MNNIAKSTRTRCFSKDSNILNSAKMYNKYKLEYVTVFFCGRKWKNSPSQYLSGAFLTSPSLLELLF